MSKVSGKLQAFFNHQIHHQLPFAIYRLPGKKQVFVLAQQYGAEKKIKTLTTVKNESGFVFAPFQNTQKSSTIFIPAHLHTTPSKLSGFESTTHTPTISEGRIDKYVSVQKTDFKKLVQSIVTHINQKQYSKIVAARVKQINKPTSFNPIAFFHQLCEAYSNAFVSLVYTPSAGIWMGATPEVLLQYGHDKFTAYSLAGTKTKAKTTWGEKEIQEQKFVTACIVKSLQKVAGKTPHLSPTRTIRAGNLFHLRNIVTLRANTPDLWPQLAEQLHPTPAVAGLPVDNAINYIAQHEPNPRLYYSGFMGPVNIQSQINLYVNLRCMHIGSKQLNLYSGCGVTALSDSDAEWMETENKLDTLLKVLFDEQR